MERRPVGPPCGPSAIFQTEDSVAELTGSPGHCWRGLTRGKRSRVSKMEQFPPDVPEDRISKYRLKAALARKSAFNSEKSDIVESFMALARAWETMALELEHAEEAKGRNVFGSRPNPLPSVKRLS